MVRSFNFSSPFGEIGLVWHLSDGRPLIRRILLPQTGLTADERLQRLFPTAEPGTCTEIDDLVQRLTAFLHGEAVTLPLDRVDLQICSPFQQQVLRLEYAVPRGRITTYGLLAKLLGRSGAARAVGNALARNPFPLIVPCHRAIRTSGHLGGYQGGLEMKRRLLIMEGIEVSPDGWVATLRYLMETDQDV